ncbi:MAG: 50S ribosomal protein L19 [Spirochaetia bacterium]|nr:50S ribosomal protein L19 [Spirochaetales bacterium]MDX9783281.1 50S ribosomal protein L19 [Spirochaetia bacterium]
MNLVQSIQAEQMKSELPAFQVGDTVRVSFKIVEGKTERVQAYEGLVIAVKNAGIGKTFTVRKNSYGVGVERVFPLNSPRVEKVEVLRRGKVRRSKLYYIRSKVGKKSKVKELIVSSKKDEKAAASAAPADKA